MYHHVCNAVPGTLLFHTHVEAHGLWVRLLREAPGPIALVLMPDHVHALYGWNVTASLRRAMASFARWRNHRRGADGRVWRTMPAPELVVAGPKRPRVERYVVLNPCRKHLCADPLQWPWSTYRDALGLAAWPVRSAVSDPHGFHAYVSADPTVAVQGTELPTPFGGVLEGAGGLSTLVDAVSAVTRTPIEELRRRGPARTGLVRSARAFGGWPHREIAALAGITQRSVRRITPVPDPVVRAVGRVLGDPRFPSLRPGDLRLGWRPYRQFR